MAAVLRFVSTISVPPGVRLDLNDTAQTWVATDETKFPPPPLKRSVTSSMMRDGSPPTASAYDNREITLVLTISSALTDNAAATQLQLLYRELDRPTNLLQYTPGGVTNPVFFRTFRTSPDDVLFDPLLKQVRVTLLAEPFALGIREDIASVTVNNQPTAANGMFINLSGIKGDVDTPLYIEYQDSTASQQRAGYALGVRAGTTPYPVLYNQAELYGLVVDTTVVADAAFSNGSKTRTTFAGIATMTPRLSGNWPSLTDPAGAENWGSFRIFARVAKTVAGDVIRMATGTGAAQSPAVTLKNQTTPQIVDLGVRDSTGGMPEVAGYDATPWRIEDQLGLSIVAERASGTGFLDIDYIVFVPADEWYCQWSTFGGGVASSSYLGVVDGPNDSIYAATVLTGGTPGRAAWPSISISGRLPRVLPGSNRLVIVETSRSDTSSVSQPHTLATAADFVCRYWPRYLSVRPLAT